MQGCSGVWGRVISLRSYRSIPLLCALLACLGCAQPPASTATSPGVDGHLAVLGGSPAAFTATYGAPVGLGQAYEYTTAIGTGVFLWLNLTLVPAGERVAQLFLQPTDRQPWDASTEEALYTVFFPPRRRPRPGRRRRLGDASPVQERRAGGDPFPAILPRRPRQCARPRHLRRDLHRRTVGRIERVDLRRHAGHDSGVGRPLSGHDRSALSSRSTRHAHLSLARSCLRAVRPTFMRWLVVSGA